MADRSSQEMYASWVGHTAYDPDGNKLGSIQDIYFDDESDQPAWITVKTGLFGRKASFAPLDGARTTDSGDDLVVAYSQDQVKDAPNIDADGALSADEEQRLYEHYGRPFGQPDRSADRGQPDRDLGRERDPGRDRDEPAADRPEAGADPKAGGGTSDPGGLRLRKYTVTEERTVKVPVEREEVRLEGDPDADTGSGPRQGE
jgi:hypothetical protein